MRYSKSTYMNLIMAAIVLLELCGAAHIWDDIPHILVYILTISFIGATCDAWHRMQKRSKSENV